MSDAPSLTPEERSQCIDLGDGCTCLFGDPPCVAHQTVADAIRAAVLAERERAATLAKSNTVAGHPGDCDCNGCRDFNELADAILSRPAP